MIPLGILGAGESGEIVEILLGKAESSAARGELEKTVVRVEDMGIRVGRSVEMLKNGGATVLLRVDESRIAIARRMAMKIMVRR
jgi:ferrous iron transport protein A